MTPLFLSVLNLTFCTLIPTLINRCISPKTLPSHILLTSLVSLILEKWFIATHPPHHVLPLTYGAINLDPNKAFLWLICFRSCI